VRLLILRTLTVLPILIAALPAFAQDKAEREADMFGGGDEPAAPAPVDEASARDQAIFGDAPATPSALPAPLPSMLEQADDHLDVGGSLLLRTNLSWREDESFDEAPLSAPSLFDAYLDVRPTDRVRGFGQLRLAYDYTVEEGDTDLFGRERVPFEILLDQVWLKFDLGRVAFVTVGKQRIRWGTGRFWNPTDFVNQRTRDSLDFVDTRTGADLLKLHFPFEALGWNLYLIGVLGGIEALEDSGVAARAEFVVGEMELALSTLVRKDAPLKVGGDVSFGLWLFDLRAEGIIQRGLDGKYWKGELDFEEGVLPEEVDTEGEWYFRGVAGGDVSIKYSDQDNVILGGEYFFNQVGYDGGELYPFLALNGAFTPFYLGRHYLAGYALLQGPWTWDEASFTLSTIANLSDLSVVSRLDFALVVLNYVTVNTFVAAHWGQVGELRLGLEIDPLPFVPGLEDGLVVPTQMVDAGVALRVAF